MTSFATYLIDPPSAIAQYPKCTLYKSYMAPGNMIAECVDHSARAYIAQIQGIERSLEPISTLADLEAGKFKEDGYYLVQVSVSNSNSDPSPSTATATATAVDAIDVYHATLKMGWTGPYGVCVPKKRVVIDNLSRVEFVVLPRTTAMVTDGGGDDVLLEPKTPPMLPSWCTESLPPRIPCAETKAAQSSSPTLSTKELFNVKLKDIQTVRDKLKHVVATQASVTTMSAVSADSKRSLVVRPLSDKLIKDRVFKFTVNV